MKFSPLNINPYKCDDVYCMEDTHKLDLIWFHPYHYPSNASKDLCLDSFAIYSSPLLAVALPRTSRRFPGLRARETLAPSSQKKASHHCRPSHPVALQTRPAHGYCAVQDCLSARPKPHPYRAKVRQSAYRLTPVPSGVADRAQHSVAHIGCSAGSHQSWLPCLLSALYRRIHALFNSCDIFRQELHPTHHIHPPGQINAPALT